MNDLFNIKREPCYNLTNHDNFHIPSVNKVVNGIESISFLEPKTWNLLPSDLKRIDDLENFKKSVTKWKVENCPCRLYKVYLQNIGFCRGVKLELFHYKLFKLF